VGHHTRRRNRGSLVGNRFREKLPKSFLEGKKRRKLRAIRRKNIASESRHVAKLLEIEKGLNREPTLERLDLLIRREMKELSRPRVLRRLRDQVAAERGLKRSAHLEHLKANAKRLAQLALELR
jgi:hypothetical protein